MTSVADVIYDVTSKSIVYAILVLQDATVRTVRTLFFPDNVRTERVRYFAVRCRTLTSLYDENKL